MNTIHNPKGLTLIEIVVAIAIMGILAVLISTVFGLSINQIFTSGARTADVMEVQEIIDDMLAENESGGLHSFAAIDAYLAGEGFHEVADEANLTVKDAAYDVNYYIEQRTFDVDGTDVTGWEVTILKFFDNGSRSVQITAVIL